MRAAADTLVPCYLELGGKDPMIVCADADVERAANAAAFYSMNNGGQVCISVERCYVEAPIYDDFVFPRDRQGARPAPGRAHEASGTVDVGAVIFPPQLDIVDEHVPRRGEPRARGPSPAGTRTPSAAATTSHGARRRRPLHAAGCREETFGPTLPIMKIANAEEGVRLTNDSAYGLPASVSTKGRRPRRGSWPGASRPASCASTTPRSTTRRSTCRWAAGRPWVSAPGTAPMGSASTPRSSRCW